MNPPIERMRRRGAPWLLAVGAAVAWPAQAAADFAPAGATATLSVQYRFEASGKQADKNDQREWRVKRGADVVCELVAARPAPLPVMQPLDAAQTAKISQQRAQMAKAQQQMAPMIAGAEAIMAKCGDDEKCLERESARMGMAMAGTAQMQTTLKTGRETAAVMQPGADRYQRWEARAQKASYTIDEAWRVVHNDPICVRLPNGRCTHAMTRSGSGDVASTGAGIGAAEFDLQDGRITLRLPVPLGALTYTETHTTDEPSGTHDTDAPRRPVQGQTVFRVTADGQPQAAAFTVALKGGWRSQSGEQTVPMGAGGWHGASGEGGKLVVRWTFTAR